MEYVAVAHQDELERRWKITLMALALFALTPIVIVIVGRFLIKESFDGDLARYYQITRMLYGGTIAVGLLVIAVRRLGPMWVRRATLSASDKLKRLQALTLAGGALGELIGILGLVAFLVTGDYQFCWRLGVVSVIVVLYCFPRRTEWARALATTTN
jgi:hypothetical protein